MVGLSHKPGVLSIHFGKAAAYNALSENGRFSAWLKFAPDGIIVWTECAENTGKFRLFPTELSGIRRFPPISGELRKIKRENCTFFGGMFTHEWLPAQ
jgi:hypothetical protein